MINVYKALRKKLVTSKWYIQMVTTIVDVVIFLVVGVFSGILGLEEVL